MNYLKTGILMIVMAGIFLAIGYFMGGQSGMLLALIISLAFNFGTFWFSEKIALTFARAKPLQPNDEQWLHQYNKELSERAGIPAPTLYISPDPQPNAFACGRGPGHASVCINRGLLDNLSREEVAGVLAHEIAHVANRDTLTMTIVASMASAIMFLSRFALFFGGDEERPNPIALILIIVVGPLAAMLVQMAVSRTREYAADAMGARLMGNPLPLASALQSLHRGTQAIHPRTAEAATAHMYIANPFSAGAVSQLFSTHPPMEERVRRLMAMAKRTA